MKTSLSPSGPRRICKRRLFLSVYPACVGALLALTFSAPLCAKAEEGGAPSLREQMREREYPPIFEYGWNAEVNDELTEDRLEDWRRMGFTGFQKRQVPFGGRHFEDGEIVTLVRYGQNPQYILNDEGEKVVLQTLFGDLAHPDNPGIIADWIRERIEEEGDNLFKVGDTYVILTGDEYDLHYGRGHVKFRWAGEEHLAAWRDFLREEYGESPDSKSARTSRSYNEDAAKGIAEWSEAPRPDFENRFDEPYLWDVYRRFLVELNHGFFEEVERQSAERGDTVSIGLSSHGSIFYPGGPPFAIGGDPFTQGYRGGALVQEAVFQDWPTSAIGHVFFNRYSREYGMPVLGWSWFWPGNRSRTNEQFMDGDAVVDRHFARMFPHDVHGLLYWTYSNNVKNFPEAERIAFWHHWYREHWSMLRDSRPAPAEVAVLFPNTAPAFYLPYQYPKQDFAFSAQALLDLQVPFTCIGEYELEQGRGLEGIQLLIVSSADRISTKAAEEIGKFLDRGGVVFSNSDSLTMDAGGQPLDLLEKHFAVKPAHKYKRAGYESVLGREEEPWVKEEEGATLPDKTPYGAAQSPFDIENPQWIDLDTTEWSMPRLRTLNEIVSAEALEGGKVLGTYQGEPVIVETDNTLWVGTRTGADLVAATSHQILNTAYEPIPGDWPPIAETIQGRAPYTEFFERAIKMAGIKRPAGVFYADGRRAHRIETGVRELDGGGLLVILSDRDIANPSHHPTLPYVLKIGGENAGYPAWDIINGRMLDGDGEEGFAVDVPVHGVAYILVAPEKTIAASAERQAKVDAMDHARKPWRHGPHGGPEEPPLPVITQRGGITTGDLPEGVVAEVRISVTNPTGEVKSAEPILLTGGALLELCLGMPIGGVSSEDAEVQWRNVSGDGMLSPEDVIAWQGDLGAGETKEFTLRFLAKEQAASVSENFTASADDSGAVVRLDGRMLFRVNQHGEWHFDEATLPDGTKVAMPPMTGFILHLSDRSWIDHANEVVKLQSAEVVADGPVFKTIRLTFADEEDVFGTVAEYTVYAQQPDEEVRIYAEVLHRIDERVDLRNYFRPSLFYDQRTMTAGLLTLEQSHERRNKSRPDLQTWYEDALGRLSNAFALEANNFGGWTATDWERGGMAQVSFRRVRGVRELVIFLAEGTASYEAPGIEADGLQVVDNQIVRAAFNLDPPDPTAAVDLHIPEGTRWNLDALISLRSTFDEAQCRAERAAFAAPPEITIESVVWNLEP